MKNATYSRRHHVPGFKSLDELFNQGINQLLGSDFVSSGLPATNVIETENNFRIDIVAVGFTKEDFKVNTEKGLLTIEAKVEEVKADETEKIIRREFKKQSFKRSFQLSDAVNIEEIVATYENGILSLMLPKKEEAKAVNKTIAVL
jgi:HSP20 family protein